MISPELQRKISEFEALSASVKEMRDKCDSMSTDILVKTQQINQLAENELKFVASVTKSWQTVKDSQYREKFDFVDITAKRKLACLRLNINGEWVASVFLRNPRSNPESTCVSKRIAELWIYDWLQFDGYTLVDLE